MASSDKLTLDYNFSSDPYDAHGWLEMRVETENFFGQGGFWVQWQEIEELAEAILQYPITKRSPIVRDWGFSQAGSYTSILRFELTPKNMLGDILVLVRIADYDDHTKYVGTSFRTTYSALEWFSRDIGRMMRKEIGEAQLMSL